MINHVIWIVSDCSGDCADCVDSIMSLIPTVVRLWLSARQYSLYALVGSDRVRCGSVQSDAVNSQTADMVASSYMK